LEQGEKVASVSENNALVAEAAAHWSSQLEVEVRPTPLGFGVFYM
jgi:hypothetical protein